MRLVRLLAPAALLATAALLSAPTEAQDKQPPTGPRSGGPESKEGDKKDGEKKDGQPDAQTVARIDRAKKLVQDLETTIAVLRAAKSVDAESMKALEKALEDARRLAKPITAAELTEEERKKLAEELKDAAGDAPAAKDPPGGDFRQRALDAAFKDVELSEDEQLSATKILNDWYPKWQAAWMGRDSKGQSDLKRELGDSLEKAVGKKKAQKIVNNVNALGGRGGR